MEQAVSFEAEDGYRLGGYILEPEGAPAGLLLINSGTGIPMGFYRKFARFASTRGFAVLTWDYRGIGASAPDSLKGFVANYREWGHLDVAAAIDWLCSRYPDLPLAVLAHSTGGQQLGLAQNIDKVSTALFVTVSTGYWKGMPFSRKWASWFLWWIYVPVATRLFGYAPCKRIGLGEDLPTGVAREWGAWCKEPSYMAAFFDETGYKRSPDGKPFGPTWFHKARFPIRSLYFTDDDISTPANVAPFMKLYSEAEQEIIWKRPDDLGQKSVGHLGFFRQRTGGVKWQECVDWLEAGIGKS